MPKWLILSNCQTFGLVNSLRSLTSDITFDGLETWTYRAEPERYNATLDRYDLVIANPRFETLEGVNLSGARQLGRLPPLLFGGYHPDLCQVQAAGTTVSGPLNIYHSQIALRGYLMGLSASGTVALFRPAIYDRCGFFDAWASSRDQATERFAQVGVDIGPAMRHWARDEPFMHMVNHPKIRCLFDLAGLLLAGAGVPTNGNRQYPVDNLLNDASFAVYPEIAEHLGVQGSYLFKVAGQYTYLSLDQFVRASFEAYDRHDPATLAPAERHAERGERVRASIESLA